MTLQLIAIHTFATGIGCMKRMITNVLPLKDAGHIASVIWSTTKM